MAVPKTNVDDEEARSGVTHVSESTCISSNPKVGSNPGCSKSFVSEGPTVSQRGKKRGAVASPTTLTGSTQSTVLPPQGKKKRKSKLNLFATIIGFVHLVGA